MSRKREHEAEKENGERWMLTYLDLITLLMIFFVVLYSMSALDAQKFAAVAESLNNALGGGTPSKIELSTNPTGPSLIQSGVTPSDTNVPSSGTDATNTAATNSDSNTGQGSGAAEKMSIDSIKAKLDKFAVDNGMQLTLITTSEERGLVVSIQETLLFQSGSADITTGARDILSKISTILAAAPNQIKVEGHTDNLPINTAKFPSNWELSVIRSINVVHILQNEGISPSRLSAAGYGEFRPIYPNNTAAGRGKNRRIDLLILRTKYDLTEPSNLTPISAPTVP
ncbi:MAG TPA: flagellar motor protein MotB, partial [Desulfosporosinus sp.]|nr:flagellar motor protein MotB [Desulfosporosinus sp.]